MGITIVGLGPGNGRSLTREAWDFLTHTQTLYLRTSRHPAVADLPANVVCHSFDAIYDTAVSFEAVYSHIVDTLIGHGREQDVVYAVPGHPFVGESTVTQLVARAQTEGIPLHIVAGLSFVDVSLTAVGYDALDGLQIFDALDLAQAYYPPVNPDLPLLLGQVYSRMVASELKLNLMAIYPDEHPVQLIHGASTDQEKVEAIPLYEIDRSPHINHLTTLFVPPLPQSASLTTLAETVAKLRSPEGCPWDQEQTAQSLRAGFLEEASEVLDAIDADDPEELCEELGDMLYHLLMQAQIASEEELFSLSDVIAGIDAKLKRRHPHVWGDWQVADSDEVVRNWELLKKQEKAQSRPSILDGVPQALPALAKAQKVQQKVAKVGFDWADISEVYAKLQEEVAELLAAPTAVEQQDELGDVLFVVANLAKWLQIDAETALREAINKFTARFRLVEQLAAAQQQQLADLSLAELDQLWQAAKEQWR